MTKVLLVDDDIDLGSFVNMALTSSGYEVLFQNALTGMSGIIEEFNPNIIILDVEVGNKNGIDEAQKILVQFPDIPIIFISSHTDIEHITKGLDVGAVNYIKKPLEISELEVYIKRFANHKIPKNTTIKLNNFKLDRLSQNLYYKNEFIKQLSPIEFQLLTLFIEHKNELILREDIFKIVWDNEISATNEDSLNNYVSRLRKFLEKDRSITFKTIKYKGYILKCE